MFRKTMLQFLGGFVILRCEGDPVEQQKLARQPRVVGPGRLRVADGTE